MRQNVDADADLLHARCRFVDFTSAIPASSSDRASVIPPIPPPTIATFTALYGCLVGVLDPVPTRVATPCMSRRRYSSAAGEDQASGGLSLRERDPLDTLESTCSPPGVEHMI